MPVEKEQRVRLTIAVEPKVHAAFERLSKAAGTSLGRTMGDWLADTMEAAEYAATMMERAREAPKVVMREVHAYAMGLAGETGDVLADLRAGKPLRPGRVTGALRPAHGAGGSVSPPSSNTGGKVPRKGSSGGGAK